MHFSFHESPSLKLSVFCEYLLSVPQMNHCILLLSLLYFASVTYFNCTFFALLYHPALLHSSILLFALFKNESIYPL